MGGGALAGWLPACAFPIRRLLSLACGRRRVLAPPFLRTNNMQGQITRWNRERGFGFIQADDGVEYFCHICSVRDLEPGVPVEFDLEDSERGPRAREVVVINESGG
jgi:CspA family cold shock protein